MKKLPQQKIEDIEVIALATPCVIGIAESQNASGEPCIKLLTSVPENELKLPDTLKNHALMIEYVGKIGI
jgi:hypothetical protein